MKTKQTIKKSFPILVADLYTIGTEVTYCYHCDKPLYTTDNISLFGFNTDNFCRNNLHIDIYTKNQIIFKKINKHGNKSHNRI